MSSSVWSGILGKTKVVINQDPHARTAMVELYIDVGSRDEIFPETKGLAHFCEHMIFRGTKQYPTSYDLYKAFYSYGAEYNGETGYDYTTYYAKISPADLEPICQILFQMVFESSLLSQSLDVEKGIVTSELLKVRSDPVGFLLSDLLHRSIFAGTFLEEPILGEKELIENFNLPMVQAFIAAFYTPDNLIISINSPRDIASVKKIIERNLQKYSSSNIYPISRNEYLNKWKSYINQRGKYRIPQNFLLQKIRPHEPLLPTLSSKSKEEPSSFFLSFLFGASNTPSPSTLKKGNEGNYIPDLLSYLYEHKRLLFHPLIINQTYIAIGFLTDDPFGEFEMYVLELLGMVVAGSSISRLFSILREEMGLIYFVDYERDNYKDSGSLSIYLGTYNNYDIIIKVISIIFEQLNDIRERSITPNELKLAREHLIKRLKITTENSSVVSSTNGIYMLYRGKPKSLEEILALYEKITLDDVQTCAQKILTYPNIHMGLVSTQEIIDRFFRTS